MRCGNRTALKRRWTPCTHRPISPIKIGYQFVYLYAAINPYNGHLIALLLPSMKKVCFELFMRHFEQQTLDKYGQQAVLLVADGASNHQHDTIEHKRINLKILPRACPELNPVERFFEQLRAEMSNQVFETIEQVEDYLTNILYKYFEQPDRVSSLTLFNYIRN